MEGQNQIRIALIGGTGAVGKEFVRNAMVDPRISELILIVRKPLEEWTNSKFAPKVTYIQKESFESYEDVKD